MVEQADIDWFWSVVERAERSPERLRQILGGFSKADVYRFQDAFIEEAAELQDTPYSNYLDPDESEDGLEDIAHHVVSQGRERYEEVIDHPDRMPPSVDVGDPTDLFPVAYQVYYERFGEPLDVT